MSLFGDVSPPRWMNPEESRLQAEASGRAAAAPFNNAFQSAFQTSSERAYKESQEKQTLSELKPVADGMKDINSAQDMMTRVGEHPEWLLNPRTASYVNAAVANWMKAEQIQTGAQMAKDRIANTKDQIQVNRDKINHSTEQQKHNNLVQDAWAESSSATRAAIEKNLPNGGKDTNGNWSAQAEQMLDEERTAKNLPSIGSSRSKGYAPGTLEKDTEYIKHLRSIGDNETADILEKRRARLAGTDRLSREDEIKEKDLTKRIQGVEKELDEARKDKNKKQSDIIPIQERLLELQSKRHKLFQKSKPQTPSSSTPSPADSPAVFTDKSGKQFKYKGSASDPSTDKDPSHWEMIP